MITFSELNAQKSACGDSLPLQIPVVFFGIKYPDTKLITTHPNVCGFTANPDFDVILRQAQKIFPRRKEVVCVIDNSFLSNKGLEDFEEEWKIFQKDNPESAKATNLHMQKGYKKLHHSQLQSNLSACRGHADKNDA